MQQANFFALFLSVQNDRSQKLLMPFLKKKLLRPVLALAIALRSQQSSRSGIKDE
jgi:hypothetical protein